MRLPHLADLLPFVTTASGGTAASGCRCSHQSAAHEHYRRGTDCALCGCRRFQRSRGTVLTPVPQRLPDRMPAASPTAYAHEHHGAA